MLTELIKDRYSVRKFQDKPIPDNIIMKILEAGRLSPSGGNEQPWIFGVITDRNIIRSISEIAYQQTWIENAPLVIVLCTMCVNDDRGGRDIQKYRYPEYKDIISKLDNHLYWALNQEEHQTKIAGTYMTLVALENGIGSCWVSLFEVKKLSNLLNVPKNCIPSEILVLGYPMEKSNCTKKKNLDDIVFYNAFNMQNR
jgi:nitroreductase